MSLYFLWGRFAQMIGLVVALLFGAMWIGTRIQLPLLSSMSQAFIDANGTTKDMLHVASGGLFIFVVATAALAAVGGMGNLAKDQRDLGKSGWR